MSFELDSFNVTESVSIAIALLALIATFWQAKQSREHNKMSVMPILMHHEDWYNGKDGLVVTFTLKNVGVGVAKITDRYFTFDNKRFFPKKDNSRIVEEILEIIFGKALSYQLIASEFFGTSACIPPGATYIIAKIIFPGARPELREVIEKMTSKTNLIITYESVYKEKFTYQTGD